MVGQGRLEVAERERKCGRNSTGGRISIRGRNGGISRVIKSRTMKATNPPSTKASQVNVGSKEVGMLGFQTGLNEDFKGEETNMSLVKERFK